MLQDKENVFVIVTADKLEEDVIKKRGKEMQKYNCGIADAMSLIRKTLESDDFKSPLIKHFETL